VASGSPSANETPKENPVLKAALAALGTFTALVAAIYVLGGAALYLRLQLRGLRTDAVVSSLPREFLISVGLAVLAQFGFYLLFLLGAFIQQVEPSVRVGGRHVKRAKRIRYVLVLSATLALAIPLSRWIGWKWAALWAGLAVSVGTFILLVPLRRVPWIRRLRVVGAAGVALGLLAAFTNSWSKPLEFALLVLAAVFTAGLLWLLLMRLVDPYGKPQPKKSEHKPEKQDPESEKPGFLRRVGLLILLAFLIFKPKHDNELEQDPEPKKQEPEPEKHDFLRRAGLLTLFAFLIFIPWRVALEAASVDSLNATLCVTESSKNISGLFIGANDNRVYLGERGEMGNLHRIAEIPRTKVERLYVGKNALDTACPVSLDSVTLPSKIAADTTTIGTVALKGIAPAEGVDITLSSSSDDAQLSPSTVSIKKEESSGYFTLTQTVQPTTEVVVVVSATSHGVTKSASVTVSPKAGGSSSPATGSKQGGR
jgi:hypothetical protein